MAESDDDCVIIGVKKKKERRARKPEEEPAQPPPVSLPKIPEVQKRADPMMNMGSLSRAPQRPTPSTGQVTIAEALRQLLPSISDVGKTPMGVDTPAGRAVKRRIAHDCLVPVPIVRQDTTTKGRVPFPGSQSGVGYSGPHATSQTQPQFLKPIQNGQSKPTFLAPQRSIQSIAIQRQAARPLRQPPTIPMAARKPQLPTVKAPVLGTGESSCATNSQRSLPQGPSLVKENANSSAVVQQQQQLVGSSNSSIGRNLVDPSRLFRDIAHSYHQRQVPSAYSYRQRQTALNPPGNATSATSSHSAPQLSAIPTIPITDREPQHPAAKTPVLGTAQAAYTKNNEVMPMEEARRRARINFFNNSYQMHRAANRLKGAGLYREIDELVAHFNSIDRTTAVLEKDMDALNLKAFLGEWIVATFSPRQAAALIVQSKKNEPRTDSERTESSSTSNTEH